jgi:hypothetical protein
MPLEFLIPAGIIGAILVIITLDRCRRRRQERPHHSPPISEQERLVQEAAEVRARWDEEREALDRAHYDKLKEKLLTDRRLMDESGVGDAACDILDILWDMPFPLEGLKRDETPEGQGRWIGWTWDGQPFRLELNDRKGDLTLSVGKELVMQLAVNREHVHGVYSRWRVSSVQHFQVGSWMVDLNEIAGRLRIEQGKRRRDFLKILGD